jgi:hypothetical protein
MTDETTPPARPGMGAWPWIAAAAAAGVSVFFGQPLAMMGGLADLSRHGIAQTKELADGGTAYMAVLREVPDWGKGAAVAGGIGALVAAFGAHGPKSKGWMTTLIAIAVGSVVGLAVAFGQGWFWKIPT